MGDTTFLFSNPSFLEGLSRAIDLGATLDEYNSSLTPDQADLIAIRNDWEAIGEDILFALRNEGQKLNEQGNQIELEFGEE